MLARLRLGRGAAPNSAATVAATPSLARRAAAAVCHQYLLPERPGHLARRVANQQACIVALADAYEILKPRAMDPNLTQRSAGAPRRRPRH